MKPNNKYRIIITAEALFSKKGFHATTVRDIAAGASVNVALIHYYFKSKEELMLVILSRLECRIGKLQTYCFRQEDRTAALLYYVKSSVGILFHGNVSRILFHQILIADTSWIGLQVERIFQSHRMLFAALLQLGINEGRFAPVKKKMLLYYMTFGMLQQAWINERKISKTNGSEKLMQEVETPTCKETTEVAIAVLLEWLHPPQYPV